MHQYPRGSTIRNSFETRFQRDARVVARAPGRVNLIGEHTDYNDGFVLPMALEQSTWVAAAPRDDGRVRVHSAALDAEQIWPIDAWSSDEHGDWTSYVAGTAVLIRKHSAAFQGCDLLIDSDVPVGGGLSSSAAIEVATAGALAHLADQPLAGTDLADLARQVEHEYAGVPCGIMDQYVSVLGRAGHAFLLDCRSRDWEHIPVQLGDHVVVIINSGVRHKLAAGEYAIRQQQCRDAVAFFARVDPAIRSLRDVTPALVRQHAAGMDAHSAARARHVVTENERTQAAADALRLGDLDAFGRLMLGSHASLRDDYQVSCRELDQLVEITSGVAGVRGARMTGGGFGGCIVAIARRDSIPQIEQVVREQYERAGFGKASLIQTTPGAGATIEYP